MSGWGLGWNLINSFSQRRLGPLLAVTDPGAPTRIFHSVFILPETAYPVPFTHIAQFPIYIKAI